MSWTARAREICCCAPGTGTGAGSGTGTTHSCASICGEHEQVVWIELFAFYI
jgi:hypothetical protein